MSWLDAFTPDLYVERVADIPLEQLWARGIRGLLLDLDNTLLANFANQFETPVIEWAASVREHGLSLCIVTNATHHRTEMLAQILGIPGIARARKPLTRGLRQGLRSLGLQTHQAAMVGDQIFTDVWAGKRAGLYTILVVPINRRESWLTRWKRPLERRVLARLARRTTPASG